MIGRLLCRIGLHRYEMRGWSSPCSLEAIWEYDYCIRHRCMAWRIRTVRS